MRSLQNIVSRPIRHRLWSSSKRQDLVALLRADPLRYLQGFLGLGLPTFPVFLEELERLGLKGERFGPRDYARALEAYLGIKIEIVVVNDDEHPAAALELKKGSQTACVWYDAKSAVARIFVLASLPPVEMTAALYHELGHLAAGHPLRFYDANGRGSKKTTAFPKRLARRAPVSRPSVVEKEARLREDYAMIAGALGPLCLENELLRQLS